MHKNGRGRVVACPSYEQAQREDESSFDNLLLSDFKAPEDAAQLQRRIV